MNGSADEGDYKFRMLGIDTSLMLNNLNDQIEFSEHNIQWQRRREFYRSDKDNDVELRRADLHRRYDDLLQRVRYGSLISLITIVERVAITLRILAESMDRALPVRPRGKSMTVHLLEVFSSVGLGSPGHIKTLETRIQVRNCIVHAAGLVDEYEFAERLRDSLNGFKGVRISYDEFWGQDVIEIEDNYLPALVRDTSAWMMTFYQK